MCPIPQELTTSTADVFVALGTWTLVVASFLALTTWKRQQRHEHVSNLLFELYAFQDEFMRVRRHPRQGGVTYRSPLSMQEDERRELYADSIRRLHVRLERVAAAEVRVHVLVDSYERSIHDRQYNHMMWFEAALETDDSLIDVEVVDKVLRARSDDDPFTEALEKSRDEAERLLLPLMRSPLRAHFRDYFYPLMQ